MASKAGFKRLAKGLINNTFADFRVSCAFELLGDYDPVTESNAAPLSDTILCIREEFKAYQIDGQIVQVNDFKILAEFDNFTSLSPRTDGVLVTVNGLSCSIISAPLDAADAVYTIHMRAS